MGFTDYKTLKETAKLIQSNLFKLAPVRTGNLRDKLVQYNTINRILGNTKPVKSTTKKYSFDASFEVEYSPPGAKYGKWWNDPTISRTVLHGKTKNIPRSINFAQNAIDTALDVEIDKIEEEIADDVANDIVDDLQDIVDNL